MKKILLAYVILTSYVNAQSLLHCLGAEESHYAKLKYTGPNYKLNQLMIEEISSLSDLKILPKAYNKICRDPKAYPSLLLLESLMNQKARLFQNGPDKKFQYSTLKTLKSNSGRLLITYLSYIQSVSATAKCIEKEIPAVTNLYSRYRYLQDVIDPNDLNGSRKELNEIFRKLKNVDRILSSCKRKSKSKRP